MVNLKTLVLGAVIALAGFGLGRVSVDEPQAKAQTMNRFYNAFVLRYDMFSDVVRLQHSRTLVTKIIAKTTDTEYIAVIGQEFLPYLQKYISNGFEQVGI